MATVVGDLPLFRSSWAASFDELRCLESDQPCHAALMEGLMKGKDSQKIRTIHKVCRHRSFLLKHVEQLKVSPFKVLNNQKIGLKASLEFYIN